MNQTNQLWDESQHYKLFEAKIQLKIREKAKAVYVFYEAMNYINPWSFVNDITEFAESDVYESDLLINIQVQNAIQLKLLLNRQIYTQERFKFCYCWNKFLYRESQWDFYCSAVIFTAPMISLALEY